MEDVMIRTTGLTKAYESVVAVDHLDLEIRRGEVFGLLGPNGAGKTTTTLMLLGLTEPTSGEAKIDGYDCTRNPIAIKSIVGYLPDQVGFYPDLTGRENLRFTGALNSLPEAYCEERAKRLLERVGLTEAADRKTGEYSRGMKQRLGIADVLMKDPKVIIMDEPTLGIDPEGMRELISLIRDLSVEDGRTILISSHQLHQVQQICDRVGIFVKGKLIACGRIEELGRQLENEGRYLLTLQADPGGEKLKNAIASLESVRSVEEGAGGVLRIDSSADIRPQVTALLSEYGQTTLLLRQEGGDLDEIYHRFFEKAGEPDEHGSSQGKTGKIRSFLKARFHRA